MIPPGFKNMNAKVSACCKADFTGISDKISLKLYGTKVKQICHKCSQPCKLTNNPNLKTRKAP